VYALHYRKGAIDARGRKSLPDADYGYAVVPIDWDGYFFIARTQKTQGDARAYLMLITGMLLSLLLGVVTFLSQGRKRRKGTREIVWRRLRIYRCPYGLLWLRINARTQGALGDARACMQQITGILKPLLLRFTEK